MTATASAARANEGRCVPTAAVRPPLVSGPLGHPFTFLPIPPGAEATPEKGWATASARGPSHGACAVSSEADAVCRPLQCTPSPLSKVRLVATSGQPAVGGYRDLLWEPLRPPVLFGGCSRQAGGRSGNWAGGSIARLPGCPPP